MKRFWKSVSIYAFVSLLSVGATYGTFTYLQKTKLKTDLNSADFYNYGKSFDQKNLHLASMTSGGYPDFTKVAENAVHAVVHIKSTIEQQTSSKPQRMVDPFEYFFGFGDGNDSYQQRQPRQPRVGFGSGVIISKDGYIMTNNHVIDKATKIEVTLNDNSKYTAKLIGTDPITDIALLKIEANDLTYLSFGNSDDLKVGEWVLAIGNPFNLTSTVTAGIVSAKARGGISGGRGDKQAIQSYIQTDAAINPGNSGGALVNTDGQLVGINTAIYSETGSFAGYGFAVPISIASKVVADIKEYGAVQRAVLGVLISDVSVAKDSDDEKVKKIKVKEGVYVGGFADRSPAKEAGVEEGDVIVAINDVVVNNVSELQEQVNRFRPGDKVKLQIKRGDADKTIDVSLKNASGNTSIVKQSDGIATVGAAFKKLTDDQKQSYGISYGVAVAGVDNDGKFKQVGISKGFIILKINNQPVSSPEDVNNIIQSVAASQDKGLFIAGFYPNTRTRYYAIDLGN